MFAALMLMTQAAPGSPGPDAARAPRLLNGSTVITPRDYPAKAAARMEVGVVSVLLHVSEAGAVGSCQVTETSASETLDARTCSLFVERAKFDPARDADGRSVAAEYRLSTSWNLEDMRPKHVIDLSLRVDSIPEGYRSPVRARVLFDRLGRPSGCEITATSGSQRADVDACAYVCQKVTIGPPMSTAGDLPPVAVRYLKAALTTQPTELVPPR